MHERGVRSGKHTTCVQRVPLLYGMWKKGILVGISVSKWYSELKAVSVSASAIVPEGCKGLRLREVAQPMKYLEQ